MHNETEDAISIQDLPVGFLLSYPVHDESNSLLLAEQTAITPESIRKLADRGIAKIRLHPSDLERLRGGNQDQPTKPADRSSPGAREDLWDCYATLRQRMVSHIGKDLCHEQQEKIERVLSTTAERLLSISKLIQAGAVQDVTPLREISLKLADLLIDDADHAIGVILQPTGQFDLSDRIAHLAALSMAISVELNMPAASTMEIGLASVLHDLSLFKMSARIRSSATTLSSEEWEEYSKHPVESADLIDSIDVPQSVRLAVAQVHEQLDGSGFPRQLPEAKIHPYAKVMNVADAYLRIIGPGPGRPPIVQHDAIGVLLHPQKRRLFDPYIMRAFLNVVTLFPLGSDVVLSDGSTAQVIRRPEQGFASPTVKILKGCEPSLNGKVFRLEQSELQIVRPIRVASIGQLRLTPDLLESNVWHPSNF